MKQSIFHSKVFVVNSILILFITSNVVIVFPMLWLFLNLWSILFAVLLPNLFISISILFHWENVALFFYQFFQFLKPSAVGTLNVLKLIGEVLLKPLLTFRIKIFSPKSLILATLNTCSLWMYLMYCLWFCSLKKKITEKCLKNFDINELIIITG